MREPTSRQMLSDFRTPLDTAHIPFARDVPTLVEK
jgi:hypothetical protein